MAEPLWTAAATAGALSRGGGSGGAGEAKKAAPGPRNCFSSGGMVAVGRGGRGRTVAQSRLAGPGRCAGDGVARQIGPPDSARQ